MGLSTAERNRRKRERKKKDRELRRQEEAKEKKLKEKEDASSSTRTQGNEIDIEYVAEELVTSLLSTTNTDNNNSGLPSDAAATASAADADSSGMEEILQKFQQRSAVQTSVVSDEDDGRNNHDTKQAAESDSDDDDSDDDNNNTAKDRISKRKLREILRPSVAELKRRVTRPDLVEAHDVTAPNPDFLIQLKSIPGSVRVPRHWGRKRKYLQGKRGYEKAPFQLPDFIMKTGIAELRDTVDQDGQQQQSARQFNRSRVAPKMGAMDVDYKTLHEAFFKHQTKPTNLTLMGDLYYEGKEMELKNSFQFKPGAPLSAALKQALGMNDTITSPPPWLVAMQRYGPPPSYPSLRIPGLTAPLPSKACQYGYHVGGWGKPPINAFGHALYGGNPFDPPGNNENATTGIPKEGLVTSHGTTLSANKHWGALPVGDEEESEEEESSDDDEDMEESSEEEEGEEPEQATTTTTTDGTDSVLPPPTTTAAAPTAPTDLRKNKQLYTVLEQTQGDSSSTAVFGSESQYIVDAGVASVLSKAPTATTEKTKKIKKEEENDLDKKFKF